MLRTRRLDESNTLKDTSYDVNTLEHTCTAVTYAVYFAFIFFNEINLNERNKSYIKRPVTTCLCTSLK